MIDGPRSIMRFNGHYEVLGGLSDQEGLKARKHQRASMGYLIKECEVL
jgi:hypothetical protein